MSMRKRNGIAKGGNGDLVKRMMHGHDNYTHTGGSEGDGDRLKEKRLELTYMMLNECVV